MTNQHYVIGIDIGTSSTKAIAFNEIGAAIAQSSVSYPLYSSAPGVAEQNPDEILAAVIHSVQQVVANVGQARKLLCLSFSAAMHSLIALDAAGKLLTPSITWADNRSASWAESIKRSPQGQRLYQLTGTPIHSMSPLSKLVWLLHEHPEIFQTAVKFISIKEYIFYRWFNQFVVDYSIASATGLFNITTLNWEPEALNVAHITSNHLSQPVPPTYILQSLKPEFASTMGVLPDTPVVVGASDGALSNVGLGAIAPGSVAITVGTSGAIRSVTNRPLVDSHQRLFCYVLTEQQWVIGGAANNGGVILQWVRDQLAIGDTYEEMMALAETVSAGAGGLIFHPYLLGERSPLWQSDARGSFFGLTINHNKAHVVRAVLEGITFNLLLVFQVLEQLGGTVQTIKAAGGFAKSPIWRQVMTDVFNREIIIPTQQESSGLGAAILGLYALQAIDSLHVNPAALGEAQTYQPIAENAQVYQRILPIYERLLNQFQAEYTHIAQLQRELAGTHSTILHPPATT